MACMTTPEQGIGEEAPLATGMQEKSRDFVAKGAEVYAKG